MSSDVWAHFTIDENNFNIARCNICNKGISRGGKSKTTSNLIKHLLTLHNINLTKVGATSKLKGYSNLDSFLKIVKPTETRPVETDTNVPSDLDANLSSQSQVEDLDRPSTSTGTSFRPIMSMDTSFRPITHSQLGLNLSINVERDDSDADDPVVLQASETRLSSDTVSPVVSPISFSSCSTTSPGPSYETSKYRYPKVIKLGKRKQQTLQEVVDRTTKFKQGDLRAKIIDKCLAEMVCLDFQPLSVVENLGFRKFVKQLEPRYTLPSRKRLSNQMLTDMYKDVHEKVKNQLSDASHIAITTDMWTSIAKEDYMAVTAHFFEYYFDRLRLTYRCLEVAPFTEVSHTADNLKSFLIKVLEDWNIVHKVVAVVRDNGTDITAALGRSHFQAIPCAAHTLQLVIKDGFMNNIKISNVIKKAKKLVGNFKHSAKLTKLLKACQNQLSLPIHRMIQDEPTRWNTTFHMLRRLCEQKSAIILVSSRERLSVEMTADDWNTIHFATEIFEVFDTATLQLSKEYSCISEIIPLVHTILHVLSATVQPGTGLQGLRNDLISSLRRRYPDIESINAYALSTILDPRFKSTPFKSDVHLEAAKQLLISKMEALNGSEIISSEATAIGVPHNEEPRKKGIWALYKEVFQQAQEPTPGPLVSCRAELDSYLNEPTMDPKCDNVVANYWSTSHYSKLKRLAVQYLCIPPSTVCSERLFSRAGMICDSKRNRLDPDRVKLLVFLNQNIEI